MNFDFTLEPGKEIKNLYLKQNYAPRMSIITAYYNAEKFIDQTFNSVMNQTFPYFEWIIVDDGSTEETSVLKLEELQNKDPRIHILHQENSGASKARNFGVNYSSSDIIVFLDADDLIDSRYLEIMYFALYYNPEATWAYSDSVGFYENEYVWKKDFSSSRMKKENILPYNAAIRKHVFNDGLYSDDAKNMWEDWQFWLKLLSKGYFPVHIKQELFWYRRLSTGELHKISKDKALEKKLMEKISSLAINVPDNITAITFPKITAPQFNKIEKFMDVKELKYNLKKINILLFLPHMEVGGADKFNLDFLKNINSDIFRINIITTRNSYNSWRYKFLKVCDEIFELPKFLEIRNWIPFIDYYIRSRKIDIVMNISSFYAYYIFPWLRKEHKNLALLDYVHADAKYWRNGGYTRLSSSFQNVIEKTIVANKVTRDIMIKNHNKDKEKCEVIYIGVDSNHFSKKESRRREIRENLNLKDRPTVLYLCRLSIEKRPILMACIVKELKKYIPDICFLVVGDGPERVKLEKYVEDNNLSENIYLLGSCSEPIGYYDASDVVLICSIKEGLTLTTFEAMSMGLPVVSSDVGGQSELVNENTGHLIPCLQDETRDLYNENYQKEEIELYVKALYDLLTNKQLCKKIGEYNQDLIREKFDFNYSVKQIEQLLMNSLVDEELINIREKKHYLLSQVDDLVDEMAVLYNTFEEMEYEKEEIWSARTWYKDLYEDLGERACLNKNCLLRKLKNRLYSSKNN